jgi:glycosyltransferase involved in cell wall biosynthesis
MEELKAKARQFGVDQNVFFLGFVTDTCTFLNSGRIYLLTSQHEGLPIAMLEAMCCGLPSVVTDVGDVRDIVIDGKNAVLIKDPLDVSSFVKAIEWLLQTEMAYHKMAEDAVLTGRSQSVEFGSEMWEKHLYSIFGHDL